MLSTLPGLLTSSMGDSPVTVMVSCECAERHRDVDLKVHGRAQQNPIALVGREPGQFRGDWCTRPVAS